MPRRRSAVRLAALLGAWAGPLAGQWPNGLELDQTPHNLTFPAASVDPEMAGRIRNFGEPCVYCHAPHGGPSWGTGPGKPLWNRPRPTTAYRMPQHSGQQMVQDPSPSDKSRTCLSCHDGSIGLDAVVNLPNGYGGPPPASSTIDECEGCHSGGNPPKGIDWEGVWFRPDMRNQHPISVLYDPSLRPGEFQPALGGTVGGLPLFNGKVECPTCHEPHSEQHRFFLRQSNVGQALCRTCHVTVPSAPVHEN